MSNGQHDLNEVITGELRGLTTEVARLRKAEEARTQIAENRIRGMELVLDRTWKDRAWTASVVVLLTIGALSVAACLILAIVWMIF